MGAIVSSAAGIAPGSRLTAKRQLLRGRYVAALLLSTGVHAALFASLDLSNAAPRRISSPVLFVEVVHERAVPSEAEQPESRADQVPPPLPTPRPRRIRMPEPVVFAVPSVAAPEASTPAPESAPSMPTPSSAPVESLSLSADSIARRSPTAQEAEATFPPRYLGTPEPDYPPDALELGQEGTVVLRVRVSADGRPSEVVLAQTSGIRALDAAAIRGIRRWTFVPARENGRPVEAWMEIPVRFVLR